MKNENYNCRNISLENTRILCSSHVCRVSEHSFSIVKSSIELLKNLLGGIES